MPISRTLVLISAYFVGPLLLPRTTILSEPLYIEFQIVFLGLFFIWSLLRLRIRQQAFFTLDLAANTKLTAQLGRIRAKIPAKLLGLFDTFPFIIVCLTSVAMIQLFQIRFDQFVFYFALGCLSSLALSDAAFRKQRIYIGLTLFLVAYSGVGYLSVLVHAQAWLWQPIPLCIGLAGLLCSMRIAQIIESSPEVTQAQNSDVKAKKNGNLKSKLGRDSEILKKIYRLALVLPPVIATAPVYFKVLPANYLILLAVLPISKNVLKELSGATEKSKCSAHLEAHSIHCALLFVILLLILRVL